MSTSSEQELQKEIEELRGELGETVQALVHKADVPARARERGNELKEEAIARGNEWKARVTGRGREIRGQAVQRGNELKGQAIVAAGTARGSVSRAPTGQWVTLACAGFTLIVLTVIVRKVRTR